MRDKSMERSIRSRRVRLSPEGAGYPVVNKRRITSRTPSSLSGSSSICRHTHRRRREGKTTMRFSPTCIKAILRNKIRNYCRNRFIVYTTSLLPLIFIAAPIAQLFTLNVVTIGSNSNNQSEFGFSGR
ncbi:MAG: hypothetical protein M1374_00835 [Firmicutes bacterium]|nr:hypothetical protein [Bacillota bacterium]